MGSAALNCVTRTQQIRPLGATMPSSRQQMVSAALDAAAVLADGREAVESLGRLVRAIDRRNLWHEIAWEPEQAAADALRDVARVRRALELVARSGKGEQ